MARRPGALLVHSAAGLAALLVVLGAGRLTASFADNGGDAFVLSAPLQGAPRAALRGKYQPAPRVIAPQASLSPAAAVTGSLLAAAMCLGLVRSRSPAATKRAHMVSLRAEADEAKAKESSKEAEEDEDEDEEEDDEEEDDEEDEDDDFEALGKRYDGGERYDEDDDDLADDYWDEEEDEEDVLEARCKVRFAKGSYIKYRRVLYQIRNRSYREALMMLEFLPWRHCKPVLCALQSAAANAQNHFNMDKSRLYIHECTAKKGPMSKRFRPGSKGVPKPFVRKCTHLTIKVREMSDQQMELMGEV